MTQATGSGGTVTHTYNGDGLKTRRVGPDGTRNYYYDGIKPIWETDAAGAMTAQLDRDIFGNLLSRREASGARRYYHFDGLGSTTALTNEAGAVAATLLYDAWGNQRAATGSGHGTYRFTGAELDQATGLYHMGARFYDPVIGRWLSEDPVQDKLFEPLSLNFYAYVLNSPLLYVDPRGTTEETPAEKRLREFINALNDLYALIESLTSRGHPLGHALQALLVALGPDGLLALLAPDKPITWGTPTREGVRKVYEQAAQRYMDAMKGLAFGLAQIASGKKASGIMTLSVAVAAYYEAEYLAYGAMWADRHHYQGQVFRTLRQRDQLLIWFFFGRP
jgi:RHS repeat-associated protein